VIGSKERVMDDTYKFRVVAWWSSGRTGIAKADSAPNAIQFTAPVAFGGMEGRWTPEDLLLNAVASCYTTTFHSLAEREKLEYSDLDVDVEGIICKAKSGYAFSEIKIQPNLTICSEQERTRALLLLQKAKTLCLVSRALSVEQSFSPHVLVGHSRVQACSVSPVV
jgi:peroxiredoxin-like protein